MSISISEISHLILLCKEAVTICYAVHNNKSTLCGQNAEFLAVNPDRLQSNHRA